MQLRPLRQERELFRGLLRAFEEIEASIPGFFGHFEKTQAKKNSSKFSEKLQQIIQKLTKLPT